ncbi:P-type conjugative transfer protein TrbL [Niveispirillum fermenti]|uniref:P-type conjugative transfer protein TrbL n=1 Tax=Niveispirillum fermenti TaxID=1233113 RepID=UPI003A8AD061
MNNTGIIDHFLAVFTRYIDSGFGLLGGEVAYLSSALIVLDLTLAGLFWAWGADEDILHRLVRKTLSIGFFAFLIGNFNQLARILFDSFTGLGLKAGGSTLDAAGFLQPGRLADAGLTAAQPLLDGAEALMGFGSFFENFVLIIVLMLAWLLVVAAFFLLAIQLFVTLIEFKLTTLAGFVLIPFALFGRTAFLAEKVLGNIVACGVKVLVLAVIVGIGSGLFGEFAVDFAGRQPTIGEAMSMVLAALSLFGLGIFGPGIATGLVSGAPQLGAGAAVGTGLAAGGLGAAAVMGAGLAAMAGAGRAVGAMAQGGARLAGGAQTAYRQGGKAGAAASTSPLRQAATRAGAAMRDSYRAGSGTAPAPSPAFATTEPGPPAWAQAMKRRQTMAHGAALAAHSVASGDGGGGSASVPLQQDDK